MGETFTESMNDHILLFDGAMGTEIQKLDLKPNSFPENKEGFNDGLVLNKPRF